MTRFLFLTVLTTGLCGCQPWADEIPISARDLKVPHYHQVWDFQAVDWTLALKPEDRTFVSPVSGERKSVLYAACWPTALAYVLSYYDQIDSEPITVGNAIREMYLAYANFPDGAHTNLIPGFIATRYPKLYACELRVDDLKEWPSDRKWKIVTGAIDRGWPIVASINWVKGRKNFFPHAIVLRGYKEYPVRGHVAIVNDPAGSETMTGIWAKAKEDYKMGRTGFGFRYPYDDFKDRSFMFVVPIGDKQKLDNFLEEVKKSR